MIRTVPIAPAALGASAALFLVASLSALAPPSARADIPGDLAYTPLFAKSEVDLYSPVWFNGVPGMPGVFLALERVNGEVSVIRQEGGKWTKSLFVKVTTAQGGEMGLLGFAFHPDYRANGKYYLNYSPPGVMATRIEERTADATRLKDSGLPGRKILQVDQQAGNHKGGTLAFGPKDGYLYVGMGDGGWASRTAQDKADLLGKFLRLDINAPDSFRVPPDNPFVGQAGTRPEIWALGIRNPWKWSLDRLTGELWVGDVGEITREEISLVGRGENMGWNVWEGTHCVGGAAACATPGFRAPQADLPRGEAQIIIGGMVYRGDPASAYYGTYFFGDMHYGSVWALRPGASGAAPEVKKMKAPPEAMSAFGTDDAGNLYLVGWTRGIVYKVEGEHFGTAGVRSGPGREHRLRGLLRLEAGRSWSLGPGVRSAAVSLRGPDGRLAASLRADAQGRIQLAPVPPGLYWAAPEGPGASASRPVLVQ
jgi:glucose/arabinose dehydrogenase